MEFQNHLPTARETAENASETTFCSSVSGFPAKFLNKVKNNLVIRSKWSELNGAMGDLGTYIPIVIALTLAKDLNLGVTLVFTGIYNIVTGVMYGVPMPVQPMKSIAAVAISSGSDFGIPEIMAAGILTGGMLFLLGITGLMEFAYRLIPLPVVRGVQLAQGLSFAQTAVKYMRNVQNFSKGKASGDRPWLGLDGLVLALVCASFIVIVSGAGEEVEVQNELAVDESRPRRRKKLWRILVSLPSALIVFLLGVVLAIIRRPRVVKEIEFGSSSIGIVKISGHAWKEGFIKGAIPQLPLSVLNSVIAVCKLSSDLFPGKEFPTTSVSMSVGLMNLVGCWFGAMPCCHGAGGLAGQYKFGGRSGGCVAVLGAAKLVLGVVIGSSIVKVLTQFPVGLLGVLLLFAGIELAMASRDMNSKEESFVMLICTVVSLVGSSAALGFGCAIVVHLLLRLRNLSSAQKCTVIWTQRVTGFKGYQPDHYDVTEFKGSRPNYDEVTVIEGGWSDKVEVIGFEGYRLDNAEMIGFKGCRPDNDEMIEFEGYRPDNDEKTRFEGCQPDNDEKTRFVGFEGCRSDKAEVIGFEGCWPNNDEMTGFEGCRPDNDEMTRFKGCRPDNDEMTGFEPDNDEKTGFKGCWSDNAELTGFEGCRLDNDEMTRFEGCWLDNDEMTRFEGCQPDNDEIIRFEVCRPDNDEMTGFEGCWPDNAKLNGFEGCRLDNDEMTGFEGCRPDNDEMTGF
ncbi:hypothetical protein HHK36_014065 [Tetracentron sinense]|uniref:Sulfate transporter n=1 Tax=Tetracentron sinense TaxID=13715 RepID=A0A834Z792_TETSI|nr:hypothetical protein HHK36_014065 [Tetracentron sinense]